MLSLERTRGLLKEPGITDKDAEEIRELLLAGESIEVIIAKAEEQGFVTLKEEGILKVLRGETTLEEVWKVLV